MLGLRQIQYRIEFCIVRTEESERCASQYYRKNGFRIQQIFANIFWTYPIQSRGRDRVSSLTRYFAALH